MDLRIKEICKEKNLTISTLANRMQIKQESLSRAINGNPTMETLQKIAAALNVEIWELFTASTSGEINGFIEYRGTIYKIQSKEDLQQLHDLVNK